MKNMKKIYLQLLLVLLPLLFLNDASIFAQNVNISTATANMTPTTVGTVKTWKPNAVGASLDVATLVADLANATLTEVRIEATTASGAENGDIIISENIADIDATRPTKAFTLLARNRVIHTAALGASIFAIQQLNVTVTANGLGDEDSYVVSNLYVNVSGDVVINATSINTGNNAGAFSGSVVTTTLNTTTGGAISITGNSVGGKPTLDLIEVSTTQAKDITLKGTNTNIMGTTPQAIKISNNKVDTNGGKIDIMGTTSGNDMAIKLSVARLISNGGEIIVKATNTNTGANAGAIDILGSVGVAAIASGGGKITITAETAGNNNALKIQSTGSSSINSNGGDIIVTATNTSTGANAGGINVENITGGGGKVEITGTTDGEERAILFGAIATTNNDIKILGTNNNTVGKAAVYMNGSIATTGTGKITIEGTNKGVANAVDLNSALNITAVDGDITIKGFANNTTGTANNNGILAGNITTAKGNIIIEGRTNGFLSGVSVGGVITTGATGGNITITGTNTSGAASAMGTLHGINLGSVTTSAGTITINGTSASDIAATAIRGQVESTSGNILVTGTNSNTNAGVNAATGIGVYRKIKNNTGNITLTGTTEGFSGVSITDEVTTSGSGNISINGTTNATNLAAYGIEVASNIKSTGTGTVSMIGRHGADGGNAIQAITQKIETAKNIFIRTTRGGYFSNQYIQSTNNGTIDICIAENGNLNVSGTIPATNNTIATGGGVSVSVRYGNTNIAVGAAMGTANSSRTNKLISNGTTTVPDGLYTNLNTGAITIRRNVTGFIASVTTPLTEANINGGVITLTISSCDNVGYVPTPLPTMFDLIGFPPCVTINNVTRQSDNVVLITLACDGTDFDTDFPNAKISVRTTATNPNLVGATESTPNLPVTAIRECPTDITLSANIIAENQAVNTIIGNFTTAGVKIASSVFTYTLVAGIGDADNSSFNINANNLRSSAVFDFEVKNVYTIRVRATDNADINCFTEKQFTINVTNVNETPTNWAISVNNIEENKAINTEIGMLTSIDVDAGNTFTYTLVAGAGDTNNASFNVLNDRLRSSAMFDFEAKTSYSIRVRTTDQGGLSFEKQLTINIINVNETPTNLLLSSNSIQENKVVNTEIGTFTSTDPDAANTFTYTLVAGEGDTDNASFNILTDKLRSGISFDFETKKLYSIRVRTTDQGGLWFEKQFTVNIIDVAEDSGGGTTGEQTPAAPVLYPAKLGSNQVTLTWADVLYAVKYEIYVYNANMPQTLVGSTDKTIFTVTGLENSITYTFRIKAITSTGISGTFSNTIFARPSTVLGTEEETANALFQVYPNPSNGSFTLKAHELKGRNATISVFDMSGRVVYSQALQTNSSVETELNLNLSSGLYLLNISTEKDNLKRKLVVQK
ncbi:MAG: T9SS C-terminal target domain-containing protein [Cytophagales bacterium]|nr:MAG: T9SS C-terminal target domain-containing protein [Cytophagales bacterium]